jgi:hypothetical protein
MIGWTEQEVNDALDVPASMGKRTHLGDAILGFVETSYDVTSIQQAIDALGPLGFGHLKNKAALILTCRLEPACLSQ